MLEVRGSQGWSRQPAGWRLLARRIVGCVMLGCAQPILRELRYGIYRREFVMQASYQVGAGFGRSSLNKTVRRLYLANELESLHLLRS